LQTSNYKWATALSMLVRL